ncbi:fungal-specific transcription factor domain-containing protein [Lentinula edodes]|nr:fungal-specific transcription factor domain-containing protein [Lentinula edodes]
MAAPEAEVQLYDEPPGGFKKRRTPGACDACKQRKIRCDSAKMPGNICSNCKAFNSECTHSSSSKKKTAFVNITAAPPELTQLNQPNISNATNNFTFARNQISTILDAPSYQVPVNDNTFLHRTLTEIAAYARSLEKALSQAGPRTSSSRTTPELLPNPSPHSSPSSNPYVNSTSLYPTDPTALYSEPVYRTSTDNTDATPLEDNLADGIKNIELKESVHSFFGNSSQLALMKTVLKIKEEYDDDNVGLRSAEKGTANAQRTSVGVDSNGNIVMQLPDVQETHFEGKKRAAFWNIYPWQCPPPQSPLPKLSFPPHSLLMSLIDLFFVHRNLLFPLLHRPTFQRDLDSCLHERDRSFGELVLSVCALGARFSSDERIFDDDAPMDSEERGHSAGWKYINQIDILQMQETNPSNALYKVQTICSLVVFLSSTSSPGPIWILLSIGVRHAQAVGAHRRTFLGTKPSVQQELWKRAYWALINLDSFTSIFLGRPKATDPAEYDLDLPIECDEEFWEHPDPEQAFKQPLGQTSLSAYWRTFLKLIDILAFAQKNIYAVKKPPEVWGSSDLWGSSWDARVVSELDSALNQWVDNIPDHLRWDPHMQNLVFFEQSCALYCTYYFVQIHVHRPFIRPERPLTSIEQRRHYSGMSYSSLGVCANAARSCLHVLDLHSKRKNFHSPQYLSASSSVTSEPRSIPTQMSNSAVILFNSAIMILLNLWSGKRLGLATDMKREMEDVQLSVRILKGYEKRYQNAGRMCDIINELISVMGPSNAGSPSRKHDRDEDREKYRDRVQKPRTHNVDGATTDAYGFHPHYNSNISNYESQSSLFHEQLQSAQVQYPESNSSTVFSSALPSSSCSSQHHSSSYLEIPSSSSTRTAESFNQAMAIESMMELPLHTEDLGRLPVLLGSDHHWDDQSINSPDINTYAGPAQDSRLGLTNELNVNSAYCFAYADLDSATGGATLNSSASSVVPPEAWDFGETAGYQDHTVLAGFVDGNPPTQNQRFEDQNVKALPAQNPFTNMFNATPARDGWFDWGMYLSNVDDLLRSAGPGQ